MARGLVSDDGQGHDSHQSSDGIEGGEGDVGGGNLLKGKIRTAVRFVTLRGAGGVLSPNDTDAKSGRPVIDVLWQRHSAPIVPNIKVPKHYDVVPEFVPLDVTDDTVAMISGKLTDAAGPGGIDVAGLQ